MTNNETKGTGVDAIWLKEQWDTNNCDSWPVWMIESTQPHADLFAEIISEHYNGKEPTHD